MNRKFIEEHALPYNLDTGSVDGILLVPSSGMLVIPCLDLDELLLAGQRLAELIEEDVEGCECDPCRGNDCAERFRAREALATWNAARKNVIHLVGESN